MSELDFDAGDDAKHVNSFIYRYLKTDGIFVMRILAFQGGIIFSTELLADLYSSYKGVDEQLKRSNSDGNLTMAQYDQADVENRNNMNRMRRKKKVLRGDPHDEKLIQPVLVPEYFVGPQECLVIPQETQNQLSPPTKYNIVCLPTKVSLSKDEPSDENTTIIESKNETDPKKHTGTNEASGYEEESNVWFHPRLLYPPHIYSPFI